MGGGSMDVKRIGVLDKVARLEIKQKGWKVLELEVRASYANLGVPGVVVRASAVLWNGPAKRSGVSYDSEWVQANYPTEYAELTEGAQFTDEEREGVRLFFCRA